MMSWTAEPVVAVPVIAAAALYVRGWSALSRRMPERFGVGRLAAFTAGLASITIAASALLDALGHRFLQVHMIQHVLLMTVAPPLLWMGAPVAPMLLGLPTPIRRAVAIGLASRPMRRLTRVLVDPRVSWMLFIAAFWIWHIPALYDLALRADAWHHVEHGCFFAAGVLFWRPVILPWPARSAWPRWAMIPYLVLAEIQNSVLAAILTFSDRVIYPAYEAAPRMGGVSALDDQSMAGVIMWVPGSIVFLLPVLWLIVSALAGPRPVGMTEATTPPAPRAERRR
jgi:cytochrome c oxidase assembly factor CtaG